MAARRLAVFLRHKPVDQFVGIDRLVRIDQLGIRHECVHLGRNAQFHRPNGAPDADKRFDGLD